MIRGITRRELLRLTGAAAGLVPLLSATTGRARPPAGLRRLVIMCWPNGVNAEMFWPKEPSGSDYNGQLTTLASLPPVLKPLRTKNVESLVAVPRNVINAASTDDPQAPTGHECYFHLLTGKPTISGSAGGPSIDQYIAGKLPGVTAFQSLQFGVYSGSQPVHCASWRGLDAPLAAENRPAQMFDTLFGSASSAEELVRLRRRKLSILDRVHASLTRQSQRLGADDRRRIADHMEAVRQLEKQLDPANLPDPMCTAGATRSTAGTATGDWDQNYVDVHRAQVAMLKLALKCGLTQVVLYQFMDAAMEQFTLGPGSKLARELFTGGFLNTEVSTALHGHYDIAHEGSKPGNVSKYNIKNALDAWHVAQFAELVDHLRSTPEGSGTMLDTTTVILINQFNNGGSHFTLPSPLLIAGGKFFKEDRVVDCNKQPLNNLYVSLCNAMGLPQTTVFGSDKYGKGPLIGAVR